MNAMERAKLAGGSYAEHRIQTLLREIGEIEDELMKADREHTDILRQEMDD